MGSHQSRPSRPGRGESRVSIPPNPEQGTSSSNTTVPDPLTPETRQNKRAGLGALRRLSTLARKDSTSSKRERTESSSTSSPRGLSKRQCHRSQLSWSRQEVQAQDIATSSAGPSTSTSVPNAELSPSNQRSSTPVLRTPTPLPHVVVDPSSCEPSDSLAAANIPLPPSPRLSPVEASSSRDVMTQDSDWSRLLRPFRRDPSTTSLSRTHSLPSPRSSPSIPGVSSIPSPRNLPSSSRSGARTPLGPDASFDQLQRRIESAREELIEARRRLAMHEERINETQEQLRERNEELDRLQAELDRTERMVAQERSRLPSGAVLVIQALAQTEQSNLQTGATDAASTDEGEARGSGSGTETRRGRSRRRGQWEGAQLDEQARMIGGLLTVAAAATATTLLSPSAPTSPDRPSPASTLSSFFDRFRTPRRTTTGSVETALNSYLQTVLSNRNSLADTGGISGTSTNVPGTSDSTDSSSSATLPISEDFQRFLEGMQGDLTEALREFAGPSSSGSTTSLPGQEDPSDTATPTDVGLSDLERGADGADSAIPGFHAQPGQVQPNAPRSAVSGGEDGVPRTLNFFRAHLFPAVEPLTPPALANIEDGTAQPPPPAQPEAMVPCVFIGVRSINHDPNLGTEELVQQTGFPFAPFAAPAGPLTGSTTEGGDSGSVIGGEGSARPSLETTSSTHDVPPMSLSPITTTTSTDSRASSIQALPERQSTVSVDRPPRRSFRQRLLDRFTPRREERVRGPTITYLVFVIGGNYPRSHPVLAIPNLITGGPLTDEEMTLIGELMGQVKPPVASQEEIERAGLKVVFGKDIADMGGKGEILDICVDRCLVCLMDYEEDEECRVLNCRHVYHKACVDRWLSEGRNSCPACRTEAVDQAKVADNPTSPDTISSDVATQTDGPSIALPASQLDPISAAAASRQEDEEGAEEFVDAASRPATPRIDHAHE